MSVTTDNEIIELVLVEVRGRTLGVPVDRVRYALSPQHIDQVPLVPAAIAGVVNLRGRVAVAVDVLRCLEPDGDSQGGDKQCLVIEQNGELYALLVDAVGEVVRIDSSETVDGDIGAFAPKWKRLLRKLLRFEGKIVPELDLDKVLEVSGTRNGVQGKESEREALSGRG